MYSFAVKVDRSDFISGICFIVKTHNYRHAENISLDSEINRYYYETDSWNYVTSIKFQLTRYITISYDHYITIMYYSPNDDTSLH